MRRIFFYFYARRHGFFQAENEIHQWENLENLFLKQIAKLPKKQLLLLFLDCAV